MSLSSLVTSLLLAAAGVCFIFWQHERMRRRQAEHQLAQARTTLRDALHDTLTGLPTGALLEEKLGDAMVRYRRTSHSSPHEQLVLFFIDVNNLKTTNDALGHDAGNELLAGVAEAFVESTRNSDVVGRLHGDEFIVAGVYTDDNDNSQIEAAAQRILNDVAKVSIRGTQASVSMGIATWDKEEDIDHWKNRADVAMYTAKKRHTNSYSW